VLLSSLQLSFKITDNIRHLLHVFHSWYEAVISLMTTLRFLGFLDVVLLPVSSFDCLFGFLVQSFALSLSLLLSITPAPSHGALPPPPILSSPLGLRISCYTDGQRLPEALISFILGFN